MADFSGLFKSGTDADIVFVVGDENIFAHKLIVAYRSSVFEANIFGELAPKIKDGEKPVIPITDKRISAENFKIFLGFLYNNEAAITLDNALALLNMADMYDVAELFKLCDGFLLRNLDNLDFKDFVAVANSTVYFNECSAFAKAFSIIISQEELLNNEEMYFDLNSGVISEILKRDKMVGFGPTTELELFNVVLNWGNNQVELKKTTENPENLREVLKSCLPFIRFPVMTVDELSTIVYKKKLLDDTAMAAVFVDSNNFAKGTTTNESTFSKVKRSFS